MTQASARKEETRATRSRATSGPPHGWRQERAVEEGAQVKVPRQRGLNTARLETTTVAAQPRSSHHRHTQKKATHFPEAPST